MLSGGTSHQYQKNTVKLRYINGLSGIIAISLILFSKPTMAMEMAAFDDHSYQQAPTAEKNTNPNEERDCNMLSGIELHNRNSDIDPSIPMNVEELSPSPVKYGTDDDKKVFHKLPETEKRRLHRQKIQNERNRILKEFEDSPYEFQPSRGEARNMTQTLNQTKTKSRFQSSKLRNIKPNLDPKNLMHPNDVKNALKHRRTWGSGNSEYNVYDIENYLADPGATYDEWQQAYRTLGAFVDCDHDQGSNSGSGDNGDGNSGCSRWMMWAAYVDPNYQGGRWDEYHWAYDDVDKRAEDEENGYAPVGSLDCHLDDTEWLLLGVYREEFYQYLEQISKHLWAEDDYEYITALAALEYIGEDECVGVGYNNNGETIYAAVQPLEKGYFQMGLYLDEDCLYPQDPNELGYTYDDFFEADDRNRRKLEDGADGDDGNGWWAAAQEYTLANTNLVYDDYKYCTSCIDYPTYQDGQLNGDSGYDDDDLINQCWKFYSHDSFTCGAECIRNGNRQGGLTNLKYGDNYFGTRFYDETASSSAKKSSSTTEVGRFKFTQDKFDRLKANIYVTFAGILFIATFLAFSVARSNRNAAKKGLSSGRGGRSRMRRKSKSRDERLLEEQEDNFDNRNKRRSKSRSKKDAKSKDRSQSRSRYEAPDVSPKVGHKKSRPRRKSGDRERRDRGDGGRTRQGRPSSRGDNSVSSGTSNRYRADDF